MEILPDTCTENLPDLSYICSGPFWYGIHVSGHIYEGRIESIVLFIRYT